MRDFSKISPRIWNDLTFRSLSDDGKIVFLYLLTSPNSMSTGLYVLPPAYAAEDLGWPPERYAQGLAEPLAKGMVRVDAGARLLFLPQFLNYNRIDNPNQIISAAKMLRSLPQSPLMDDLADAMQKIDAAKYQSLIDLCRTLSTPLPEPLEQPLPQPLSQGLRNGMGNKETETETKTETKTKEHSAKSRAQFCGALTPNGAHPPHSGNDPPPSTYRSKRGKRLQGQPLEWFEQFWQAFDLKRGKAESADAWLALGTLDASLAQAIIAGAQREAAARPALISSGGSPKWPQGWLSGRRWEDEHQHASRTQSLEDANRNIAARWAHGGNDDDP